MARSTLRVVGEGVAWNTVSSTAVKVLALVNIFLVLRHLSVYEYGLVQLVLSAYSTIETFLLPGLSGALLADLGRDRGAGRIEQMRALARGYFILQFVLSVLAFGALFFGASIFASYLGRTDVHLYLSIIAFGFLINPLRAMLTILTSVELRFKLQSLLSALDEGFKFLWLLVFFYGFGLTTAGVLYATVLTPLLVFVLTLPWTWSLFSPLLKTTARVSLGELFLPHRRWSIATSYLGSITQNTRIWIIKLMLGTEAVGLFAFAQGIVSQASGFLTFPQIVNPILARAAHERDRFIDLAQRLLKYQTWLTIVVLIPGIAITPLFVHLLFPAYVAAIPLAMIALVALLATSYGTVINGLYPALQLQRTFFFNATILKFITMITLMPLSILTFGLMGVTLEPILTSSISVFERTRAIRKSVPGFLTSPWTFFIFDRSDRDLIGRMRDPALAYINRVILRHDV